MRSQIEELAEKSLVNCHAMGVDSVMLRDVDGDRLRAFVTDAHHTLWLNSGYRGHGLSVAIHPHHCDVTITPVFGEIYNVTVCGRITGPTLKAYRYQSQITGSGRFLRGDEKDDMIGVAFVRSLLRKPLKMSAKTEHTVFVPHAAKAGWFVHEGAEDAGYSGLCWSNADLENFGSG